jgi:hypothetical protein
MNAGKERSFELKSSNSILDPPRADDPLRFLGPRRMDHLASTYVAPPATLRA